MIPLMYVLRRQRVHVLDMALDDSDSGSVIMHNQKHASVSIVVAMSARRVRIDLSMIAERHSRRDGPMTDQVMLKIQSSNDGRPKHVNNESSSAQFSSFIANLRCRRVVVCCSIQESAQDRTRWTFVNDESPTSSKSSNFSLQFSQYPGLGSRFSKDLAWFARAF